MIIKQVASFYRPLFAKSIVYMLQATEYNASAYLHWFWRTNDFSRVMRRGQLAMTKPSRLLLAAARSGMLAQVIISIGLLIWSFHINIGISLLALALFVSTPIIWAHLILLPLVLGRIFIIKPYVALESRKAAKIFAAHPAIKIAVAGSYGKTTTKEILHMVLGEGKRVAATPANRNVAISHAQFAKSLKGDEEILIIEYGEGEPGDVMKFSRITHPDIGVITGLAPAHLDKYKTLSTAGEDIFSLAYYLRGKNVYVNKDSQRVKPFIKSSYHLYSSKDALDWAISDIKVDMAGTSFVMSSGKSKINLTSQLIGENFVGTLALAVVLGLKFGLSEKEIKKAVAKTKPFEHRMQPRPLAGGWLIDDTYNGNIEGMLVGLKLLKQLPAKRKIYVTPGLVDQGEENKRVHNQLGKAIAQSKPDSVVLMKNSVTNLIKQGLEHGKYKSTLKIESDPLDFYTNIEHFMAAGDLVLMQNDWPDNYY